MFHILFSIVSFWLTSIYSLQFIDADGNEVSMNSYQNKKILIVNIATGSTRVNQLAGLQQLQETHGDSVVVIAFPSNSFGHEPRTTAEIKQFCQQNYGVTFKIAEKDSVTGPNAQPIFNWLAHIEQNGERNATTERDFQKFLIDKNGMLIGLFGPSAEPMGVEIISAITNQYQ